MSGRRAAQVALGVGSWLWVAGLLLAPVALEPFCAFICHQRPERSFFVAGRQLPVCARCTGLYVGAALAVPIALVVGTSPSARRARYVLSAAAIPTALTWTLEFAGILHVSNAARFIAALALGGTAAWLVLAVIGEDR